jgi:quinoprotein glucose dehydrogenase
VRYEGLFTPPDLKGALALPATRGGANWGGVAFDPKSNYLYIRGNNLPEIQTIIDANKYFAANNSKRYEYGRTSYSKHCATCHGAELKGVPPSFPTLEGLKGRVEEHETLLKIRQGDGQMPGFKGVLTQREERGLIAFLYDKEESP